MHHNARGWLGVACLATLLAGLGCARVRPLSGGPPDTAPPQLLGSTPADSTAGVPRVLSLHLRFDEKVARSTVGRALRTYPPLRPGRIQVNGRDVRISFQDTLPADTTLIVVLGEALEDAPPRRNSLEREIVLRLATGPRLRSAAVYGQVRVKGKPAPDGAVRWEPLDVAADSAGQPPARAYPAAACDAEGLFRLFGIPPGRPGRLRAFLDRNHDVRWDPDEIFALQADTLVMQPGEVRRGVHWDLIDPNEPARLEGVAVNRTPVDGRLAVALLSLDDSTAAGAGDDSAGAAPRIPARRPTGALPPAAADSATIALPPRAPRDASPWAAAYARLDSLAPQGLSRRRMRVVYASPRGDYSLEVRAGRHRLLAFVDAARDSMPGLYVVPDSTRRDWEPLWLGEVLEFEPGEHRRRRGIDIE